MITVIRRHIKTKLFQLLVWFFVVIFGIFLVLPNIIDRIQTPEWVIEVNGQKIEYPTFARTVAKQELNIRAIREQYGPYAEMFMQMLGLSQDPKISAFNELVRNQLVNEVVEKIPLYIHDTYIEQKLNNPYAAQQSGLFDVLPTGFFTQHGLDQQALQLYLARNRLNMKQFELLIEQALARHLALAIAGIAAYTPTLMIKDAVDRELSTRNYTILTIPVDTIKKEEQSKTITQDELQAFFDAQNTASKRYWVPEMRSAIIRELNPTQYGLSVSDDAIKEYYEKHRMKKYVDEPTKVQVRRILFKLSETEPKELLAQRAMLLREELAKDPDSFDAKAREYSDDKESAEQGGMLPFFAKGERDAAFERKAFTLKEGGEISQVFESPDGYEIIQRVEKKMTSFKPLADVKGEIHDILLRQLFAKQFNKDMKWLLDQTRIDEDALVEFLKEKKGKLTQQDLAPKDNSKRMQLMFRLKEGKADFYTEGDIGYIVQITEVKKRHLPNLESVLSIVREDFIEHQSQNALAERLNQAFQTIKTESPKKVAQQFEASIRETGPVSRGDEDKLKKLQEEGIPTQLIFQIEKKGSALSHIQGDGYIFYVSEVNNPQIEEYNEKSPEIINRINNEMKGLFTQGLVASLSRNAKIETNESLFTQIETQAL